MSKFVAATTAGMALIISVMIIPYITPALGQRSEHHDFTNPTLQMSSHSASGVESSHIALPIIDITHDFPLVITESTVVTDANSIQTHVAPPIHEVIPFIHEH